jgi:hypothetical protein
VTICKRVRLLRRTKARVAPSKSEQSRKRQAGAKTGKRAVVNGFMQSKRVKKLLYIGLDVHSIGGAARLKADPAQRDP